MIDPRGTDFEVLLTQATGTAANGGLNDPILYPEVEVVDIISRISDLLASIDKSFIC